jgi:TPR repeat protein
MALTGLISGLRRVIGLLLLLVSTGALAQSAAATPAQTAPTPASVPAPLDIEALAKQAMSKDVMALARLDGACEKRNSQACLALGIIYYKGSGVGRNPGQAAIYFEKGCAADDGLACRKGGEMYEYRDGVSLDRAKAVALYRKACDLRDQESCADLSLMIARGEGVAADPAKAHALLSPACDAGHARSCANLSYLYQAGIGVAKDPERADALSRIACSLGNEISCVVEAARHMGGKPDAGECLKQMEAEDHGCSHDGPWSCTLLAFHYEKGDCIPKDMNIATEYYEKACRLGATASCQKFRKK